MAYIDALTALVVAYDLHKYCTASEQHVMPQPKAREGFWMFMN